MQDQSKGDRSQEVVHLRSFWGGRKHERASSRNEGNVVCEFLLMPLLGGVGSQCQSACIVPRKNYSIEVSLGKG